MAELKTFLFTDIVGSVELKRKLPGHSDAERDQAFIERVLTPHRERIERELAALGGRVVSTAGDGNFLVFSDTVAAARWAIGVQRSHRDEPILATPGQAVEVRISMHLGIPQRDPHDPDNFVGKPVDYAARLSDYATSGQILASRSVVAVLEDAGVDGVSFHSHGKRELKGIGPVEVWELVYDRAGPHPMGAKPREHLQRQWTVLPPTMGLTEFKSGRAGVAQPQPAGGGGSATDVVPLRLGNYELEQRLGTGGMGDVYKARHVQFGRVRAVKVIKQHFVDTGHEEVISRFYQEIKAVGGLEHPNIVVAIDSSLPTDAIHYLVMEYIEGIGADELVARHGPLPVPEACEIVRQAARGLAYIHQHGMVHRDIKPSNLMLTVVERDDTFTTGSTVRNFTPSPEPPAPAAQPVVKILDLGLALLIGDDQQRLTLFDHRAMGTAMYMSPEQWKTTSVDIRADIYSLGCTLYHLLAGKPPFWESDLKPEKAHEREKLPPIGNQEIPRELWDILQQMTAKRPLDRFNNPADIAAALAPLAEGNQLARLVADTVEAAGGKTQGVARGDTLVAGAQSDTLAGTPGSWSLVRPLSPAQRRRRWRIISALLTLSAVAAIGWLALAAWEKQARDSGQRNLEVAANYAASAILGEVNERFAMLSDLARDRELREQLLAIEAATDDAEREHLRIALDQWLGATRSNRPSHVQAESWFVTDRQGVQIARSPQSSKSTGKNYSHRDYFHGQGKLLEPGTSGIMPIEGPHLSRVYRSTSDGTLRVAFSVPIENGRSGEDRAILGVLAMSVDLGDFDVLQRRLPKEYEVVLIDLRDETIDDETRRGLVLHHPAGQKFDENDPPPWLGAPLLALIEKALAGDAAKQDEPLMLGEYRDKVVTRDKPYWGAIKAVIDRRPDRPVRNTGWVVLVQEPLPR